jgi:thymidylate synthase (FAD)
MKIILPYARIINAPTLVESMGKIEWCGRVSHRSEDNQTDLTWKRFIETVVLGHGDWSIVEHVSVTVDAVVDRGITHEWVRHRLFSFTQESTRFVNYEKKMVPSFIYPKPDVECEHCLSGSLIGPEPDYACSMWKHGIGGPECAYCPLWIHAIAYSEQQYTALIRMGWRPQEARSVFPNALASRLVTTGNLRNWRHFFIMRTTAEAHPQMRQVTIPLLAEFQKAFPLLFDDIVPMAKQSESMKRIR